MSEYRPRLSARYGPPSPHGAHQYNFYPSRPALGLLGSQARTLGLFHGLVAFFFEPDLSPGFGTGFNPDLGSGSAPEPAPLLAAASPSAAFFARPLERPRLRPDPAEPGRRPPPSPGRDGDGVRGATPAGATLRLRAFRRVPLTPKLPELEALVMLLRPLLPLRPLSSLLPLSPLPRVLVETLLVPLPAPLRNR